MATGISGLASGFNSDTYITAVMNQEKIPLTNLQTKQSKLTAYKTAFTTLNTKMNTLKSAATNLKDISNFQALTATSSDMTKMSVKAGTSAISGNYTVKVDNLATASVYQSTGTKTMDLSALSDSDKTIQLKTGTDSVVEITLRGSTNEEILTNLATDINKQTGAGINASVIQTATGVKNLVLTSKEAGEDTAINFTTPFSTLPLDQSEKDTLAATGNHPVLAMSDALKTALGFDASPVQAASNATLTINGVSISSSSNTVDSAIPGVILNLTDVGTSTIKVSQDTAAITDKIDTFVKAYNDIVSSIRNSTATPDTSSSDSSTTLTLQGDSLLRDLQSQLNDMMNTIVGDTPGFKLLSDIGLEVDKGVTSASEMTGTLTFDKDAFLSKLSENPDAVQKILTGGGTVTPTNGTPSTYDGFGAMFESRLKVYTDSVDGLITSKIKGYSDDIDFISDQITDMQNRLDMKEAALKQTYANLEVVMSSLNSTSSWLTSQISSLTKSSS